MATSEKNLSEFSQEEIPSAKPYRFGIVASEWNDEITSALSEGAYNTLLELGATEQNITLKTVPGTFELPVASKLMIESEGFDALIAIGSVIQGETRHFEFVCQAAAQGIKDVGLQTRVPVIFCVLTDDTKQQAIDRSGGKHGNKGIEAAVAAVKMAHFRQSLS